jgi:hypothetical protein
MGPGGGIQDAVSGVILAGERKMYVAYCCRRLLVVLDCWGRAVELE